MTRERIYLSKPDIEQVEKDAVLRALDSGWVAPLGPEVDAFEAEVAERCNRKYAVALSSGTAALHLGLLALGVKPGDVVVTATMTFAATANAITYVGAEPYFVDCLPETGNMDPELLDAALDSVISSGRHVGAVVPVDLLGKIADYLAIQAVVDRRSEEAEYEIPVFSDAAESFGAALNGSPAGSFGVAAVLSFNGNKIMTTSGGGMFLTDDKALADRVRYLATQARQPVVHYEHTDIGYNYRMSNVLAALGRGQLTRLDQMIEKRRDLRKAYKQIFEDTPGVVIFGGANDAEDNCWLTSIIVDPDEAGWTAADLSTVLSALNIESRPLWKPMHMQPVFEGVLAVTNGSSEELFEAGLTLPSGSGMKDEERVVVVKAIREFLAEKA